MNPVLYFLLAGGFPVWLLLVFGGVTLVYAARFAHKPRRDRLAFIVSAGAATGLTAIMGVFANLCSGAGFLQQRWEQLDRPAGAVLLHMASEAIIPGVLGFGLLSIAAALLSVGFFREDAAP